MPSLISTFLYSCATKSLDVSCTCLSILALRRYARLLSLRESFAETCAQWTPLIWRLGCTSVLQVSRPMKTGSILTNFPFQHLGGIHSGCAISGIAWLLFKVIMVWQNRVDEHNTVVVLGTLTNIAVFLTACSAIPWVRNTHHKYVLRSRWDSIQTDRLRSVFERHHRFVGWTALFLTCGYSCPLRHCSPD